MEKLKPCPFCGGFGVISKNIFDTHYCVKCCSCGCSTEYFAYQDDAVEAWNRRSDVHDRNVGEWDMFELITSVYFGKQYYFVEENGIVYSRSTHKHMTKDDAIREFLDIIGE